MNTQSLGKIEQTGACTAVTPQGVGTRFAVSDSLRQRFHRAIPGGAHTYAKGDDQFPESCAPFLVRGEGCRVWDVDGNEFIEYGMGLRAVSLGHAHPRVNQAASREMQLGSNFTRPAVIELECAEALLRLIQGAEMVKFGKNGSDATTAAVKLARACTGREMVGMCASHPFFSVDDWFIGSTPMDAGIPACIRDLTVSFRYNDLQSVEDMFAAHPGKIACLILEPDKGDDPKDGFLHRVQEICRREGTLFILDEMITGFRWHLGGAQAYHGITPDLSTFGKALGNGFSVSALVGRAEFMRLGGIDHESRRVFLMSTTHGAETHGLAAALEVMRIYQESPVIETLWQQGRRLKESLRPVIAAHGLEQHFTVGGKPCCLVFGTNDADGRPSQPFRTLFMREMILRGVLAPSFVVSYAHRDEDIDRTVEAVDGALEIYKRALHDGIEKCLPERSIKPVWRRFN